MPQPIPPAAAVRISVVNRLGKSFTVTGSDASRTISFGIAGIVAVNQGAGEETRRIVDWRHVRECQLRAPSPEPQPMFTMRPIVQISLDVVSIDEALSTAEMSLRAGVDWLEAGTPLIIAEGMNGVRALRERFPKTPIVADLKTMDGGYLEAELMAKAGATHVVVMARAHEETIRCVVKAGRDVGIQVMGDNLAYDDMVAG